MITGTDTYTVDTSSLPVMASPITGIVPLTNLPYLQKVTVPLPKNILTKPDGTVWIQICYSGTGVFAKKGWVELKYLKEYYPPEGYEIYTVNHSGHVTDLAGEKIGDLFTGNEVRVIVPKVLSPNPISPGARSEDRVEIHYGNGFGWFVEMDLTKGLGSVPSDVLSLMKSPIYSTWGISDSAAEAWFLSTNTAVIRKYGLNSTNISDVTVAIKAAGVSPVLFYAYTVNEGGGLGGFINHYKKDYYANNGGGTAVNAASGDAQYLADQSKIMNSRPAWVDLGQDPPLRIDFVPQSVKDSGNASFASMPSGSIGRAYIPATAAATWEVYYPDGLLKSYNQVQNYGAPLTGVLSFIVAMSK